MTMMTGPTTGTTMGPQRWDDDDGTHNDTPPAPSLTSNCLWGGLQVEQ